MNKQRILKFILENLKVYDLNLPANVQNIEELRNFLHTLDEDILKVIAGFNKSILNYFLKIVGKKSQQEINQLGKKLEKLAYYIRPTGNLSYLTPDQISYTLEKLPSLSVDDITPKNISEIADEKLEEEFGGDPNQYSKTEAFQNQIESARYYLSSIGYKRQEIDKKLEEVKKDPSKLDEIFTLEEKEIYNIPNELQGGGIETATEEGNDEKGVIEGHIQSIQQDINDERAKKVAEILSKIKSKAGDKLDEDYKRVYKQMHPDRLKRAYKFLKESRRDDDRKELYLEWFFSSHLLENIELKVEHWQVSSGASHESTGVYTAGVSFSRYDNIIKEFSDKKLGKVLSIARKILKKPSKKRIQKLGQDLIAETGFDEHLYFTD
jgi:hypothetical protein